MDKTVDKSIAVARILKIKILISMRLFFLVMAIMKKMLIAAGLGLVMANALKFKSKLSHLEVISTNDDDGVAKLLSDRVLNRKRQQFLKIKKNCFYRFQIVFLCKLNHKKIKGIFIIVLLILTLTGQSQNLKIEEIMKGDEFIGSQPTSGRWSLDGKKVYFEWNPNNELGTDTYFWDP
jgi:hypothetical protein